MVVARCVWLMSYAELHALSNFTFLRGASHPEEMVTQAAALGYKAIAITDECSLSGIVRAHGAAKSHDIKLICGAEFQLDDGPKLTVLANSRSGYAGLCRLITTARRAAPKGRYSLGSQTLLALSQSDVSLLEECSVLWSPGNDFAFSHTMQALTDVFRHQLWIAAEVFPDGLHRLRFEALRRLSARSGLPLVAAGDVHMHVRERRALQDTLTAIRLGTTVAEAGYALHPNGERHLRRLDILERLYPKPLLNETLAIAERCNFSLDSLRYEYPRELVPDGYNASSWLRHLAESGAAQRWPDGVSDRVTALIEHELELIQELSYEPYFLTVHDIVRWARQQGILCQGRGSAANSVVCFCLGITEVDPARQSTLVERFISRERNEPPDIDVDFEHQRREEVIQYIYKKYGRERAALAATVICYRPRSAMRDVGKALGLHTLQTDKLARSMQWWDGQRVDDARVREAGLDPDNPILRQMLSLVRQILGFPRHLSQHVGGFVIAEQSLDQLVPVENASMPERTVIQWEKDDLESLGLLKVDVLGLGMLSAIRRCFKLIENFSGESLTLATVPAEDPVVYDMICDADTMGVFQIESRAQMSMLPRLRPRRFYDLVIEVAIIRPGPIQGGMVHPYLRRRNGEEPVTYPSEAVRSVLKRTLGVPIFQEQVMELAVVAAGFTPGEADQLRRAMAAWKRRGGLGPFEEKLKKGMHARGYDDAFAAQIFAQIKGFGEYGFPESHSVSFALLVYVSSWLKCHHPAAFVCALINSQPMGFYSASQLTQMLRRKDVEVRPVDVQHSDWDCTIERTESGEAGLRLGMRLVKGLPEDAARRVVIVRNTQGFRTVQELATRALLDRRALGALAAAGALTRVSGHRYLARWEVAGVSHHNDLLAEVDQDEFTPLLRAPSEVQDVVADYRHLGLSLGRHPMAMLRDEFERCGYTSAIALPELNNDSAVSVAGIVVTRQRPGSAGGVTFVTLEDESGYINLVIWKDLAERQRKVLLGARLMGVRGRLQKEGKVIHVVASRLDDHNDLLSDLTTRSRDFH
ncbi:MAG: error-prone DNA polymerase [Pseudomonadota bacterium]